MLRWIQSKLKDKRRCRCVEARRYDDDFGPPILAFKKPDPEKKPDQDPVLELGSLASDVYQLYERCPRLSRETSLAATKLQEAHLWLVTALGEYDS